MASDESMTNRSCISMQEDGHQHYDDDDTDDSYDHQPHPHSLSRLSICTRSSIYEEEREEEEEEEDDPVMNDHYYGGNYCYYQGQGQGQQQTSAGMDMHMSLLSIDSFDGDIDDEILSSTDNRANQALMEAGLQSSDSDKEPAGYYSLPATPQRRRPRSDQSAPPAANPMVKEYASENEAQTIIMGDDSRRRNARKRSRRRIMNNRHSWLSPSSAGRGTQLTNRKKNDDNDDDEEINKDNINCMMMRTTSSHLGHCHSFSGESDGGSCCTGTTGTTGTGVVVITRPKGGRRSLCMDLEEVKACRDLGFELEHQQMLQEMMTPSRLSVSHDTNTTCSSGGNSPIANWCISSPGDDPREVKARLKVWAQAVALASTARQGGHLS